ncbi:hypothetical protein [Cypionkella psychrotolerans]|uniref:hypothetical protein n=1 Tax=Cypionkella psychrotolerans TaxID=1678131 RepID=UPI0006B65B6A|nr:hypothetical protein [Cypionkella psychrotolerans]
MDRKSQLRNVAFGGAWSEQITGNEAIVEALRLAERAGGLTSDEDLRLDQALRAAINALAAVHPKGAQLRDAWARALNRPEAAFRMRELEHIAALFRKGLAARLR